MTIVNLIGKAKTMQQIISVSTMVSPQNSISRHANAFKIITAADCQDLRHFQSASTVHIILHSECLLRAHCDIFENTQRWSICLSIFSYLLEFCHLPKWWWVYRRLELPQQRCSCFINVLIDMSLNNWHNNRILISKKICHLK